MTEQAITDRITVIDSVSVSAGSAGSLTVNCPVDYKALAVGGESKGAFTHKIRALLVDDTSVVCNSHNEATTAKNLNCEAYCVKLKDIDLGAGAVGVEIDIAGYILLMALLPAFWMVYNT